MSDTHKKLPETINFLGVALLWEINLVVFNRFSMRKKGLVSLKTKDSKIINGGGRKQVIWLQTGNQHIFQGGLL